MQGHPKPEMEQEQEVSNFPPQNIVTEEKSLSE